LVLVAASQPFAKSANAGIPDSGVSITGITRSSFIQLMMPDAQIIWKPGGAYSNFETIARCLLRVLTS
jgi:hypothetical protein